MSAASVCVPGVTKPCPWGTRLLGRLPASLNAHWRRTAGGPPLAPLISPGGGAAELGQSELFPRSFLGTKTKAQTIASRSPHAPGGHQVQGGAHLHHCGGTSQAPREKQRQRQAGSAGDSSPWGQQATRPPLVMQGHRCVGRILGVDGPARQTPREGPAAHSVPRKPQAFSGGPPGSETSGPGVRVGHFRDRQLMSP